ncbi:RNA polymerase subunit sigma-54 [Lentibacillus kapialis]|uniref:RNA polymerase subunit sigma-54 n=1 Tax=Lentibacillus kapialis TaxID=340214 RepID=A0A917PR11_9BACI|nr:sigma 54-interacting transcriptional regulator [Lentibacillus kapialis]GGJ88455.1 RNA polymerase subunit sigma-54 [Lentibacillus kapialis]
MKDIYFLKNADEEVIDTYDEDIIITNRQGRIIKVTNISGSLYDLEPHDLLGQSVYDLEERAIFSPAITPLVLKKRKKAITVQTTPNDRKVLITGIPLFNEYHDIEYVLSYSYEVSELFMLQEYLDELYDEMSRIKTELANMREASLNADGFIVRSQTTRELLQKVKKVAPYDADVVLQGEQGVGKSKIAHYIHTNSKRKNGPFITMNCSSIPDAIFERELAGKTSGEHHQDIGLADMAQSGTLYLEGVDHLSLHAQHILIKVLKAYNDQFRVIASTETSLTQLMTEKKIRKDLYYELQIVPVYIPALRERSEDLKYAIDQYKERLCDKYQLNRKFSKELYLALLDLDWPGNFFEVKHVIERMIVQSESETLTLNDLPFEYRGDENMEAYKLNGAPLNTVLENVEKQIIQNVKNHSKTTTEMAEILGISQPSVVRKLKKYSIQDKGE